MKSICVILWLISVLIWLVYAIKTILNIIQDVDATRNNIIMLICCVFVLILNVLIKYFD